MKTFCGRRLRRLGDESGQAIIIVGLSLVVLLGFAGLAIDVGNAYFTQRELQKAADAAALSGALELPNPAAATAVAQSYGAAGGDKNEATLVKDSSMTVSTRCVPSLGCVPSRGITTNVIAVKEEAAVPTYFAKLFGFDTFNVSATATACSPCDAKPLDIMIVLDRTGSMCQLSLPPSPGFPSGRVVDDHPQCTDLRNARDGIRNSFLPFFEPTIDKIGLAVFPPVPPSPSTAQKCAAPDGATGSPNFRFQYDNPNATHVIEPLSSSFGNGSQLWNTLGCLQSNGTTSYADAIEQAQAELNSVRGRPNANKIIVFFSDGAANTAGTWHTPASSSPYRVTPCQQGVTSASRAKTAVPRTSIYSIGYDLDGGTSTPEKCKNGVTGADEGGITAYDAIRSIATSPLQYYDQRTPGALDIVFRTIALDIASLNARLVPDDVN